jgi:pimeloyl-ACP methyl ester carboxylesterase
MTSLQTADAVLYYQLFGSGPDLVLLHPFPLNHHFWDEVVSRLSDSYRVITPDLRGHGQSELGNGPATMDKHAADLLRLCQAEGISHAVFVGVSIGGYALFEFWRRHRERVVALVLSNTRASAETAESRANRLRIADQVLSEGAEAFVDDMLGKLLGSTTRAERPDIVDAARLMMQSMAPEDIAGVQRGMADRPDSVATLSTIDVPTLVIAGAEDVPPLSAAELMRDRIPGSTLHVIPQAGHYAAIERPEEYAAILSRFVGESIRKIADSNFRRWT